MSQQKRIADPIHGTIGLSDVELEVLESPSFQRLRNVKQLGLAHLVYPGADFSRFSHSVGVCHVTGLILHALKRAGAQITPEDQQIYRLAALMHDIGHYPFSHAMEEAADDYYASQKIRRKGDTSADKEETLGDRFFNHERVGKEILTVDSRLSHVLEKHALTPRDIYSIFLREEPPKYANLVSSSLDADRIDYLLRTAHHTGLPYGTVDLEYLVSQISLDSDDNICLSSRALRTADHFLLSRYFDYQQVAFHKTVAALEMVLKDVIGVLLEKSLLDCSATTISTTIAKQDWESFDDAHVMHRIRQLHASTTNRIEKDKARAVLQRRPPKLIVESEKLGERSDEGERAHRLAKQALLDKIPDLEKEFSLDRSLFYVWDKPGIKITKVASHAAISAIADEDEELLADRYEQEIRILDADGTQSTPITQVPHSIMSLLGDKALYMLRLYILLPDEKAQERPRIQRFIKKALPNVHWK